MHLLERKSLELNGFIRYLQASFVVKGYSHMLRVHYNNTFVLVARLDKVRLLNVLVIQYKETTEIIEIKKKNTEIEKKNCIFNEQMNSMFHFISIVTPIKMGLSLIL